MKEGHAAGQKCSTILEALTEQKAVEGYLAFGLRVPPNCKVIKDLAKSGAAHERMHLASVLMVWIRNACGAVAPAVLNTYALSISALFSFPLSSDGLASQHCTSGTAHFRKIRFFGGLLVARVSCGSRPGPYRPV
jgi:hypothetical protein